MTLQQFFNVLSENPAIVIFYFVALPLTAFLAGILSRGDGHQSPWKYLYCILLYMAAIPGVFAITLNVYLFLFERQSILNANIYTQFLPVIAMVVVFLLISRKVDLRQIPGFDRLTGMLVIVGVVISAMWVMDKLHIVAFTFLPFQYVLILIVVILIVVRLAWKRVQLKR